MSENDCVNVAELEIMILQKGAQFFDRASWVNYYKFLRFDDYDSITEWKRTPNNNMNFIANSNRAHLNLTSFWGYESDRCFSPAHS